MNSLTPLGLMLLITLFHQKTTVITTAMMIPQDIEVLDGYKLDESSEYYPQDSAFLEAESLRNFALTKAIRNKRSVPKLYQILQSPAKFVSTQFYSEPLIYPKTVNHQISSDNDVDGDNSVNSTKKQKRDTTAAEKSIKSTEEESSKKDATDTSPSSLPTAEKQVMEPAAEYYRKGSWNIQSFDTDYGRAHSSDDDELTPEATINDGIKGGRTPRVNFITQPKKSMLDDIRKDHSVLPKYPPPPVSRYERIQASPPYSSAYPDFYPSRSYDPYLRRYDRYDDQYNRYDPYYEDYYLYRRRYDPYDSYSPRTPTYPEAYYDYPDRRFDVPEPRDYRPLYSNDLYYDRSPSPPSSPPAPSSSSSHERNNRRIIYYAHLPEIVRTPPSMDLTYSSSYGGNSYGRDSRYDTSYSRSAPAVSAAYHHANVAAAAAAASAVSSNSKDTNYGFIQREKKDHRNYPSAKKQPDP